MDVGPTCDLEAQEQSARSPHLVPSITSSIQSERPKLEKALSAQDATRLTPKLNSTASLNSARGTGSLQSGTDSIASLGSDLGEPDEKLIYRLANELQDELPVPAEPWYMEMTTLRRINFIDINNKLAKCRKKLYDTRAATEDDIKEIRELLHIQADAIRDFEYIRSLDYLSPAEQRRRHQQSNKYFEKIAKSRFGSDAFESRAYRRLRNTSQQDPWNDEVQRILLMFLPVSWTWTKGEKEVKGELYDEGRRPSVANGFVERVARFIIAMAGSLFILVPMYIMALHQSQTKNLITTTVAVVLFAITCSIMLKTSNDQTLAATFGYAAVLMVFVGLTTQGNGSG